jgi:uncharacterized membrane protein
MSTSWRSGDGYSLLPPPADLDRYVQHLPDAAERLRAAAEREQAHRHQLETRLLVIDADTVPRSFESHRRVCWIALLVGLVHLATMVVAILGGYGTAGTAGAALGMAAIAWATRPLWEIPHLDEAVGPVGEMRTKPAPAMNPRPETAPRFQGCAKSGTEPRRSRDPQRLTVKQPDSVPQASSTAPARWVNRWAKRPRNQPFGAESGDCASAQISCCDRHSRDLTRQTPADSHARGRWFETSRAHGDPRQ